MKKRISIFGLGYVGSVTAACFAKEGFHVIGIDLNKTKVDIIDSGRSPIIEKDLDYLIKKGVESQLLEATTDEKYALLNTDISFICVGTPSNLNGSLNLEHIERVIRKIGNQLKEKSDYHIIVIRSTVLPGTVENTIIPILEENSGKKVGTDIGIVFNPEFLRESSAVQDFYNPPKTVIGAITRNDADEVGRIYRNIDAPIFKTSIKNAEMIKYADNVFHSLKVTFANEIGNICKALNIDSHEVMDIFCEDTKLNLSSYYLKPGFAFGGSCLPKDLRALIYMAKTLDVNVPVLNNILYSNELQIRGIVQRLQHLDKKKIGVLGIAFKVGTDDLREAPIVELAETLIGKGYEVKIYDKYVSLAKLFGANKEYIEKHIPHISNLMVDSIQEIVTQSEVIIIGNNNAEFLDIFPLLREEQYVIDLVRIAKKVNTRAKYDGICW